jgi:hypothetical protein
MNDIFSFRRFYYLLKKQIIEKRLFLLGISTIVIFLEISIYYLNGNIYQVSGNLQYLSLFVLLILSPTILISFILNSFSDIKTSIGALLLPVSFFEKWLMIFAIVFLTFVPSHLLILKFIDYSFVNHYKELAIESKQFTAKRIHDSWPYISYVFNGNSYFSYYLMFSVYCSGIFLLGTLYFKNLSYFKTALVLILVLTFVLYGGNYITETIIGENSKLQFDDFGAWIQVQPRPFLIQGKMTSSVVLTWYAKLVLPLALWLIAILRFREKEI